MSPTRILFLLAWLSLTGLAEQVADTKVSLDSGFYTEPIEVALTTATEDAYILYTTDGTEPDLGNIFTPPNGTTYEEPITISSTTVLRVQAFSNADLDPTNTDTRTYFFLQDVIRQPLEIEGWPRPNLSVGQGTRQHDYEMDPRIVGDGEATVQSLLALPTMSLVVDPEVMWSTSGEGGFYRGNTEEAVDVEILYPDIPTKRDHARGIIQGHSHDRLKRSLRLKFKGGDEGDAKFDTSLFRQAPLHAKGAPNSFDRLVLRAGNNRSWARSWNPAETAYTMDEWYRATQIASSGYGARGAFVHLYINGLYWGLYNATERLDRWYSREHFGGEVEDWFAISHGGDQGGNDDRWRSLLADADKDLSVPENYEAIVEKLDVSGMIDYLLITWYLNVTDWPRNNWWASMQNEPAGPARFFAWDGEWSFGLGESPGRAWVHPDFAKSARTSSVPVVKLWLAARSNSDFMTLVADRAHHLLIAEGGALTDTEAKERWQTLNNHVREGVLAESARWGDAISSEAPRTVTEDWQNEVDRIDARLTGNSELLIERLRDEDYYPDLDPPVSDRASGHAVSGSTITLSNPNTKGVLYITTDGSDPRDSGGAIAETAQAFEAPIELTGGIRLKARVLVASIFGGKEWSALTERAFHTETPSLQISELMYHPAAPTESEIEAGFTDDDDFEYLELTNTGATPLQLQGIQFTDGIRFHFREASTLAPSEHAVLVSNREAFDSRYGANARVLGLYEGALSNGGETIALMGAFGEPIQAFTFDDDWHETSDGDGKSLVLTDAANPNNATSWQASTQIHGSPGQGSMPLPFIQLEQKSETQFELTISAEPERAVTLEFSTDLSDWKREASLTTTSDGSVKYTVTVQGYYRARFN